MDDNNGGPSFDSGVVLMIIVLGLLAFGIWYGVNHA